MACNPDHSGMLAVGAYSGVAGLYDLGSAELLLVLQGHQGGITQVPSSHLSICHCSSSGPILSDSH